MSSKQALSDAVEFVLSRANQMELDGVSVTVASESGISVSARAQEIEAIEHQNEIGMSIHVYHNQRHGYTTCSELTPYAMGGALEKAAVIASYAQADSYLGLPEVSTLAFDYPQLKMAHATTDTIEDMRTKALLLEEMTLSHDACLLPGGGATLSHGLLSKCVGNSAGFLGFYERSYHSASVSVLAKEKSGGQQAHSDYTIHVDPQQLQSLPELASQTARDTLSRCHPDTVKTCQMPILFHAPVAKTLWRHFLTAISGRSIYTNRSFLKDKLHQYVFPKFMQIEQKPHAIHAIASVPFDSEGVKTQDLAFVKDGVLQHFMTSSYSARKLGLTSTGNAGGIYNMQVTPNAGDCTAMLQELGEGLLVTDLMGQGVDIISGNYSRGATGFWVSGGKISHPVDGITIAGNLVDMYAGIRAVGCDIDSRSSIQTGSVLVDQMTIAGHA